MGCRAQLWRLAVASPRQLNRSLNLLQACKLTWRCMIEGNSVATTFFSPQQSALPVFATTGKQLHVQRSLAQTKFWSSGASPICLQSLGSACCSKLPICCILECTPGCPSKKFCLIWPMNAAKHMKASASSCGKTNKKGDKMSAMPASARHTGLGVSTVRNISVDKYMPAVGLLHFALLVLICNSAEVVYVNSVKQCMSKAHDSHCHEEGWQNH